MEAEHLRKKGARISEHTPQSCLREPWVVQLVPADMHIMLPLASQKKFGLTAPLRVPAIEVTACGRAERGVG